MNRFVSIFRIFIHNQFRISSRISNRKYMNIRTALAINKHDTIGHRAHLGKDGEKNTNTFNAFNGHIVVHKRGLSFFLPREQMTPTRSSVHSCVHAQKKDRMNEWMDGWMRRWKINTQKIEPSCTVIYLLNDFTRFRFEKISIVITREPLRGLPNKIYIIILCTQASFLLLLALHTLCTVCMCMCMCVSRVRYL